MRKTVPGLSEIGPDLLTYIEDNSLVTQISTKMIRFGTRLRIFRLFYINWYYFRPRLVPICVRIVFRRHANRTLLLAPTNLRTYSIK